MPDNTRVYWLHALTPLHVGAGRGVGYIDLPIMREKVTQWPLVPGSAVKGVLRDHHAEKKDTPTWKAAFGSAGSEHSNSGSLVFTDARLVCLPVRSLYGTFAWCTSPLALRRLHRDLEAAGAAGPLEPPATDIAEAVVHIPEGVSSALVGEKGRVFFEDLDFTSKTCPVAGQWSASLARWLFADEPSQNLFRQRFAVVAGNVFDFLCETGTEVTARVRLDDEQKTVAAGALWYEEALPAETILGGLAWCDRVFGNFGVTQQELLSAFCPVGSPLRFQVGGKATVGRGQVHCSFQSGGGLS